MLIHFIEEQAPRRRRCRTQCGSHGRCPAAPPSRAPSTRRNDKVFLGYFASHRVTPDPVCEAARQQFLSEFREPYESRTRLLQQTYGRQHWAAFWNEQTDRVSPMVISWPGIKRVAADAGRYADQTASSHNGTTYWSSNLRW